jgi:hypothetical protein
LKESEFLFRVFAENSIGLSAPTTSEPVLLKSHASKIKYSSLFLIKIALLFKILNYIKYTLKNNIKNNKFRITFY